MGSPEVREAVRSACSPPESKSVAATVPSATAQKTQSSRSGLIAALPGALGRPRRSRLQDHAVDDVHDAIVGDEVALHDLGAADAQLRGRSADLERLAR